MASTRQLGPRSSLFSHSFPSFYACYLLKSIQAPHSKATYIGSTPSPPRRIRQHNGELTQGASKTKRKRPWVMQMIVHGFPSRLAALQFEWAWQHPHVSRHLRDPSGKALFSRGHKSIKTTIKVVRSMISNHPYNTWPLHIKLFTDEAVRRWNDANSDVDMPPIPPGFTSSIELEGVDGNSGQLGSGRHGPINVQDEQFTSAYLAKNTALLAANFQLKCSVCRELLTEYTTDALSTALCPQPACTAVSHLACLSTHFLAEQASATTIVPRGGHCVSCRNYILWGDVVRGSYRRMAGDAVCEPEDDVLPEDDGELFDSDSPNSFPTPPPLKRSPKRKAQSPLKQATRPRRKKAAAADMGQSSEGESFDFNVSSSDEPPTPPKRGRPRKIPVADIPGPSTLRISPLQSNIADELPTIPHKRGRPPKVASISTADHLLPGPQPPTRKPEVAKPRLQKKKFSTMAELPSDSDGEFFDYGVIDEESEGSSPRFAPGPRVKRRSIVPPPGTETNLLPSRPAQPPAKASRNTFPQWTNLATPMSPDYGDEAGLSREMSSLSVSSPAASPRTPPHRYVEISD